MLLPIKALVAPDTGQVGKKFNLLVDTLKHLWYIDFRKLMRITYEIHDGKRKPPAELGIDERY